MRYRNLAAYYHRTAKMVTVISLSLAVIAGLLSIPVVVLLIEVVAALRTINEKPVNSVNPRPLKRIAVIVPAHNESSGILPTIEDIKSQLGPGDRLIVVADNCSDDTATVAAAAGAQVISRNDTTNRQGLCFGLGDQPRQF